VVCSSEEASGTLVDRSKGLFAEEWMGDASNSQVMVEILLHPLAVDSFQVASGNNPGSKGQGSFPVEFVQEVILSGQDERKYWFGVSFKLG
jgi:hypothetical protein